MAKGISEKSQHYSLLALNELNKITTKYSSVPDVKNLKEEEISWINDHIRSFHESVVNINYKNFSFLPKSKEIRNKLAHSTSEITNQEISDAWKTFYNFSPAAKKELENNINKSYSDNKTIRKFEKFASSQFGNEIQRKLITQSLAEQMDLSVPEKDKLLYLETQVAQEANKFIQPQNKSQKDLLDFAKAHGELNEQIQAEIIQALQDAYKETEITKPDNPFYKENLLIKQIENLKSKDFISQLSEYQKILNETQTGKDNSANFDFYRKQYEKEKKPDAHKLQVLARNLKTDLHKSLTERYTAWQINEIDKQRWKYLAELYKKIEQFKKLKDLLSPIIGKFGRLWDLSKGIFANYGFEILKDFADLLEQDESLKELADLIGRQDAEIELYEKELRESVELKTEYHPQPAFKGQISGLRLSGEISSTLPSELAMSKNPATRLYFAQKFAEKKLLSYAYINQQASYRQINKTEEVMVPKKDEKEKGPVILCIDTSGSMSGPPERIAKTLTFALAKKCIEEDRACFLMAFSTNYKEHNLTEFDKENGLTELVNFLRMSFRGGTDASPALIRSLELIKEKQWEKADVLVISDMLMPDLPNQVKAQIKEEQEKESRFFSLVIGSSGNQNVIDVFNENWSYNLNATDSMRHLVRQIKKL